MSILIKNGIIVTVDRDNRIIKDGAVYVEGDRIAAVGKTSEVAKEHRADKVIDASGKIIIPGLINLHSHTINELIRGLGTDVSLTDRLEKVMFKYRATVAKEATDEDVYAASALGYVGSVRQGCTYVVDNYNTKTPSIDNAGNAAKDVGIRLGLWADTSKLEGKELEKEMARVVKKWHDAEGGKFKVLLGPVEIESSKPEVWRRVHAIGKRHGLIVATHLCGDFDRKGYSTIFTASGNSSGWTRWDSWARSSWRPRPCC